jgi:hypothetical protein
MGYGRVLGELLLGRSEQSSVVTLVLNVAALWSNSTGTKAAVAIQCWTMSTPMRQQRF